MLNEELNRDLIREHYSSILRRELKTRKNMNSSYSLRGFSKKLGISASKMSDVLNQKQKLSVGMATRICNVLGFSSLQTEYFLCLVKIDATKNVNEKKIYQKEAERILFREKDLIVEKKVMLSKWYIFSLLILIEETKNADPQYLSRKLGVEESEVLETIAFLTEHNIIVGRDETYSVVEGNFIAKDGMPSNEIRKFNESMLEKAKEAIWEQNIEERYLSTLTVGVNANLLPVIFEKIASFRRELNEFISLHPDNQAGKDEVYCLSNQFFRITKKV